MFERCEMRSENYEVAKKIDIFNDCNSEISELNNVININCVMCEFYIGFDEHESVITAPTSWKV